MLCWKLPKGCVVYGNADPQAWGRQWVWLGVDRGLDSGMLPVTSKQPAALPQWTVSKCAMTKARWS